MSHDINSQQSFETLPLKPNGQSKTWVRTTESHPIQQSPGMNRPVEFAGGAFRNSSLQPNQREHASSRSSSSRGRNLGPPPLYQQNQLAPTPPVAIQRNGNREECSTARLGQLVQIRVYERPRSIPRLEPKHPGVTGTAAGGAPPSPHRHPAGPQAPAGRPAAPPLPSACAPPPPMKRCREHTLPAVAWTGRAPPPPPQSPAAATAGDLRLFVARVWWIGVLASRPGEERPRKEPIFLQTMYMTLLRFI